MEKRTKMKVITYDEAVEMFKNGETFFKVGHDGSTEVVKESEECIDLWLHMMKEGTFAVERRGVFQFRSFEWSGDLPIGKERRLKIRIRKQKGGEFIWSTVYCRTKK